MRLTDAVLGVFKRRGFGGPRFHFVKHIPGKIDIGKVRIVPPVTPGYKLGMWQRMLVEEEAMMYLQWPYLTKQEDKHVPREICNYHRTYWKKRSKEQKPLKTLFAADLLAHINTRRQWEE